MLVVSIKMVNSMRRKLSPELLQGNILGLMRRGSFLFHPQLKLLVKFALAIYFKIKYGFQESFPVAIQFLTH